MSQGVLSPLWNGTGQVIRTLGEGPSPSPPFRLLMWPYPWNNCPWCWDAENSEKSHIKRFMNCVVFCHCLTWRCVRGLNVTPLLGRGCSRGAAHGPQCHSARGWWGIRPHGKITVILWEWVRIPMTLDLKTDIMLQSAPHFLTYQGFSLCAQKSAFVGMGCSSVEECCPLCVRPWVCSLSL